MLQFVASECDHLRGDVTRFKKALDTTAVCTLAARRNLLRTWSAEVNWNQRVCYWVKTGSACMTSSTIRTGVRQECNDGTFGEEQMRPHLAFGMNAPDGMSGDGSSWCWWNTNAIMFQTLNEDLTKHWSSVKRNDATSSKKSLRLIL